VPRPIRLDLSFSALEHNLQEVIRRLEAGRRSDAGLRPPASRPPVSRPHIWGVVKANAYGHGLELAVGALAAADGLAMLDLEEAVRARQAGWQGPIMLLEGFFQPQDIAVLRRHGLSAVIHCSEQLDMLEQSEPGPALDAWVKLNVGMNRLGFAPSAYVAAWDRARALHARGVLATVGRMSHFSRADDDDVVTAAQRQCFLDVTRGLDGPVSICNSAATLNDVWHDAALGDSQWVRPGVCLYGGSPFATRSAAGLGLRPVQTLHSQLLAVHDLAAGAPVGYGHQFVAPQAMRVGIVACGYADGYPRHAPNGTPVTVAGVRTRLLGRVSMDMLAVDLDPVPTAAAGAPVVLWGEGGPSVDEVARAADTIGYELMCAVAPRVPRREVK